MPKIVKSRRHRYFLVTMQHKLKTLSLLIIIVLGFSCSHQDPNPPLVEVNHKAIRQFIHFIDLMVETLANEPPKNNLQTTDILVSKIPEFEKRIGIKVQMSNSRGVSSAREPIGTGGMPASATRRQLEEKIVENSRMSTSASDYLRKLAALEGEVRDSRISGVEKSELMTLVALNAEFVRYLDLKVLEITKSGKEVAPAMKCNGWWSCWGKCVSGTVGGAGLGVLTGASYGGVGCTMILPVVGTVACGTVGAIAGGIFGGLAGAAAAC